MKQVIKNMILSCLVLAAMLSILPPGAMAAQSDEPVVTGYKVTNASGSTVASIRKGDKVDITVSVKDIGTTTDKTTNGDLDITKLVDSFSGGKVSAAITSSGTASLTYDVSFSGLTYSGSGKNFRMMAGYKNLSSSYDNLEFAVTEAVEYDEPKPEPPRTPEAAPAPMVLISRNDIKTPISAGKEMDLTITFQNLGYAALSSPVVTFTPSESIMLTGGSTSFALSDIGGKKSQSISIRVKAQDSISSATQSLGVELKFNYYNNISSTQATVSDKISIPAAVSKLSNQQPPVIVTRSAVKPISAGQTFDMTVTFKNAGKVALQSPVATFSTSDSLIIQNDTSTFVLDDIAPGKTKSVSLKVKAAKEISSSTQSINSELKFAYDSGEGIAQASTSERLNISSYATDANSVRVDSQVPNIIITGFNYGGDAVSAGDKFTLKFSFGNTGRLNVENIVVTVDSGESFAMDDSTNTFYYSGLGSGKVQSQEVPMQVLPGSKTGAQTINISFKYEHVDGGKRASSTAEIKLSIPVCQPDRFQVNQPVIPESVYVGEEASISLAFVNKGKSEVSNVEASVEGDVDTPAKIQYLGNFEPGKSGTIGFALTPKKTGKTKILLKVSYEDANQQVKTMEFPVTLDVKEAIAPTDDGETGDEEGSGKGLKKWVWIALAAVAAGGIAAFVVLKKKKRSKKTPDTAWDDWDYDLDSDEAQADRQETREE